MSISRMPVRLARGILLHTDSESVKGIEMILKIKKAVCILILAAIVPSLVSCGNKKKKFTSEAFGYFDTVTTIVGYETDESEFKSTEQLIYSRLESLHAQYDIYKDHDGVSGLYRVNSIVDGKHPTVTVSEELMSMLEFSKEAYELTDGEANIAMGSVTSLWHTARENSESGNAAVPDLQELIAAAKSTDINALVLDRTNMTVCITDPEVTLDVGAIAKGYAVELVARELEKMGKTGYILNVGGNVRTVGSNPDGESFIAGISDPDNEKEEAVLVRLGSEALVTSGSYQRYFTVDGKRYHHIIDKDTLLPSAYFTSVTVLAADSGLADALSTALFSMPLEDGKRLVNTVEGVEAFWITTDGEHHCSQGFAERIVSNS